MLVYIVTVHLLVLQIWMEFFPMHGVEDVKSVINFTLQQNTHSAHWIGP